MLYRFVARSRCPSCKSPDTETRYRVGFDQEPIGSFVRDYYAVDPAQFSGAPYQLDRCRRCTLLFQHWVGDDQLLVELYGDWIERGGPGEEGPRYEDDIRTFRLSRDAHELMVLASYLDVPLSELVTFDYGMGWALWARIAAMLGCRSYGSDLSPTRMKFASEHGIETITDDEIGTSQFHFINTDQVFEHVPDPAGLARKLARALVPGGILKISVPLGDHVDRIIALMKERADGVGRDEIMPVQPLEHINCFTKRSLEVLAKQTGLALVKPGMATRYAFLCHRGSMSLSRPRKALKELVRPFYTFSNGSNLYRWLRKPG